MIIKILFLYFYVFCRILKGRLVLFTFTFIKPKNFKSLRHHQQPQLQHVLKHYPMVYIQCNYNKSIIIINRWLLITSKLFLRIQLYLHLHNQLLLILIKCKFKVFLIYVFQKYVIVFQGNF